MASLYFVGSIGSGKTAILLGLALFLKEQGVKVCYLKPIGNAPGAVNVEDRDAVLMQETLDLSRELQDIAPLSWGSYYISIYKDPKWCHNLIKEAYLKSKTENDTVLLDGAMYPWAMAAYGLDVLSLAREFGAAVIYVLRPINDRSLDEAVSFARSAKEGQVDFAGVIFSKVPRVLQDKTEGIYQEALARQGIETLGIVPHRPELSAPTVAEFYEALGGDILVGEDKLGNIVEDVLIGAMTIESALGYFRRSANKAVITGGDRADIALAALETDTAVLVLTGGLYPNVKVIARAAEKGVPVLLVHHDTYSTIERMAEVSRVIRPSDLRAIELARESVAKHCRLQRLMELARR